jgi:P27 family predicted phage terminase small subunit
MGAPPPQGGGRAPLPTALKALQGTLRPDRVNPHEPKPAALGEEVGRKPPNWIHDLAARRYWRELVPILQAANMLAVTDTTALSVLAVAYGRWRKYEDFLQKHGETYEAAGQAGALGVLGPAILQRPRPEVHMRDKAEDRLLTLLREFGLTPSSRSRVSALPSKTKDEMEELLSGRSSA